VLRIVDGAARIVGRGPREARPRDARGVALDHVGVGQHAARRAQHVEAVKRRHTRPRLRRLHARVRKQHALGRGAHRHAQEQALVVGAIGLGAKARQRRGLEASAQVVDEQRIFARTARKQALCEARHEHHAEREAPRFGHRRDEHAAVTMGGRRLLGERERIGEHVGDLVEADGPDRGHGAELHQQREHGLGATQGARGEIAQTREPRAPRRGLGEGREQLQHGQGEAAQVLQIGELLLQARDVAVFGLVATQALDARAKAFGEARESPRPALFSAEHRGLDQQLLPAIRGPKLPRRQRPGRAGGRIVAVREERRATQGLGHRPRAVVGGRTGCVERAQIAGDFPLIRHLPEGEVFGEALRRQALPRTREQRTEGPPRRMRTLRAHGEIRGDRRPAQGVLEVLAVELGGAQQHGHGVERHAAFGLVLQATGDLHRFPALARRGPEHHALVLRRELVLGSADGLEQPRLQAREGRGRGGRGPLRALGVPEASESGERGLIPRGHRDEPPRRGRQQRADEALLGAGADGQVEQHLGHGGEARREGRAGLGEGLGREGQQARPIHDARAREHLAVAAQELGEIPRRGLVPRQSLGCEPREAQLVEGRGEGAREAGRPRDGRHERRRTRRARFEHGARHEREATQRGRRSEAPLRHGSRGEDPREAQQRRAKHAKCRPLRGASAGALVEGEATSAEQQHLLGAGLGLERRLHEREARRSARPHDDAERTRRERDVGRGHLAHD
jgi:hypothetical protein